MKCTGREGLICSHVMESFIQYVQKIFRKISYPLITTYMCACRGKKCYVFRKILQKIQIFWIYASINTFILVFFDWGRVSVLRFLSGILKVDNEDSECQTSDFERFLELQPQDLHLWHNENLELHIRFFPHDCIVARKSAPVISVCIKNSYWICGKCRRVPGILSGRCSFIGFTGFLWRE